LNALLEYMLPQLDSVFIERALRLTSFNLTPADFNSTKYKKEIQTLYQQYMFKSFDPNNTLSILDRSEYNNLVKLLKSDDLMQYERLHNLPLKGIGPGEAALFLLTKSSSGYLGGGTSAGVDFILDSKKYEVKAVKWKSKSTKDYVVDFKLGGNIPNMSQLESEIQQACYNNGYTDVLGAPEIKGSIFKQFEKDHPSQYAEFEKRYQDMAKGYFAGHDVVFIQTEYNQPDFGEIISIKNIEATDIKMERYTNRSIKPIVKI